MTAMEIIALPEPHRLIPPLLATLPTAFASYRPPPALFDLVSPILQQRLQHLSSISSSPTDSWLELLCWDKVKAEKLRIVVENGIYEPHPSSGEIEVGDIEPILFKHLDQETLQARILLPQWQLCAIYLWCGGDEACWRLAELQPYDKDMAGNGTWTRSIPEASQMLESLRVSEISTEVDPPDSPASVKNTGEDSYWAQYDKAPEQTPDHSRPSSRLDGVTGEGFGDSDDHHYARYGEVQAAMDSHDPSEVAVKEEKTAQQIGMSNITTGSWSQHSNGRSLSTHELLAPSMLSLKPTEASVNQRQTPSSSLRQPDDGMLSHKTLNQPSHLEAGMRLHVRTVVRSLYSLARTTGIDAEDFVNMTRQEVSAPDESVPKTRLTK